MAIARLFLLLLCLVTPVRAVPGPGDIFREFTWSTAGWQRVTDPDASHAGAQEFLPNSVTTLRLSDLAGATRAEFFIEKWGGHAGTSAKGVRLNGGDWIGVPEPDIPGRAANTDRPPECWMQFTYPSWQIPLDILREGNNTVEFNAGPQVCHDFGWGQWGVYGFGIRLYYSDDVAAPTGRILSPTSGAGLGDLVQVEAEASSPNGAIRGVDFIALYEDFDYEGNGVWRQWHVHTFRGRPLHHVGSTDAAPFSIQWDTRWIPDQPEPISLMARIEDETGLVYLTSAVPGLTLQREASVRMIRPYDVPTGWQVRAGERAEHKLFIDGDPGLATDARLAMVSWSGGHASAIGVNETTLATRVGQAHEYSYDTLPVPLDGLRPGINTAFHEAETQHHGIELMWPGMVLFLRYPSAPSEPPASQPVVIYQNGPAAGWQLDAEVPLPPLTGTELATVTDGDSRVLQVSNARDSWGLVLHRPEPIPAHGIRSLRFALRPVDVSLMHSTELNRFGVEVNGKPYSLLGNDIGGVTVDLDRNEWQVVEVPWQVFGFGGLQSLRLHGAFSGSFLIDDIRLIPQQPSTAVTAPVSVTPNALSLPPAFPNPFNAGTMVRYDLATDADVELTVSNLAGQRVVTLDAGPRGAGTHTVRWDGRGADHRAVASGIYFLRLVAAGQVRTQRLLLLR